MTATTARPAFPTALADLPATDRLPQFGLAASALDDLRKAYLKHHKWQQACTAYSLGGDEPNLRQMPSKDAKHRLYGAAGHLTRVCGWGSGEAVRCHNLDDIAALIAAAESALRAL